MSAVVSADVVVLGAGPAGLGAAMRLAEAGRSVVLLERDARVGGLAASFTLGGLRVDLGSHRLHPSTTAPVMEVLRRLLGTDLQIRPRNGRMRIAGRFTPFPPRIADLTKTLPPRLVLGLARDAAIAPTRRARADTFADVVRAQLGPTMLDMFYAPYIQKIWGLPATELSGELARRRVSARGPMDLVRKAVKRDATGGSFCYPRRGFGQIADALATAASDAGADIRLDHAAIEIDVGRGDVRVRTSAGVEVHAPVGLSTLPINVTARLVAPALPSEVMSAAARLTSRGVVLVYLVVERPQWTTFDAHYLPALDTVIARVSEPKNYRVSADDPEHLTVLCAELPATPGDELWASADADLGALVADQLAAQGLPHVVASTTHVQRLAHVYPVYRVGYERDLSAVTTALDAHPQLLTLGRHGSFAHDNSHHSLDQAWAAADALASGTLDVAAWRAAREAFKTHVVED